MGRTARAAGLRFRSLALLGLLAAFPRSAWGLRVDYVLSPIPPSRRHAAETRVLMRVREPGGTGRLRLVMPAWTPGDYRIVHHGLRVRGISAADARGRAVPVRRTSDDAWEIADARTPCVTVRYTLPNSTPDNFTENIIVTRQFAYYEGAPTFLLVDGHTGDPATLAVRLPVGWRRVVSPLRPTAPPRGERGPAFASPDYDTLADSPLLAGACETRSFRAAGRDHTIAWFRDTRGARPAAAVGPIRRIVEWTTTVLRSVPYERYVFFVDCRGPGGALEHAGSCRIGWDPPSTQRVLQQYVAHEYFHLWNVKRIRPEALAPIDYEHPRSTAALWFLEGVTEYYGWLALQGAGLVTPDEFATEMADRLQAMHRLDARREVTAEECSLRVWEANNSEGYRMSYYLKGELIGLCLDLALLSGTPAASLDDVMRDLWGRWGVAGRGFPETELRDALVRFGGSAMGPLYDRCVRSTSELPEPEMLAKAGLRMVAADGGIQIEPDPAASEAALRVRDAWRRRGTAAPGASGAAAYGLRRAAYFSRNFATLGAMTTWQYPCAGLRVK